MALTEAQTSTAVLSTSPEPVSPREQGKGECDNDAPFLLLSVQGSAGLGGYMPLVRAIA